MENISYIENDNSLVILFNKLKLDNKTINSARRFFLLQETDFSHIPYVSDEEQLEIQEILINPDCHEFVDKNIIEI